MAVSVLNLADQFGAACVGASTDDVGTFAGA
jgi:hypothetical protein